MRSGRTRRRSSLVRTFAQVLSAMSVRVRVAVDDDRPFDRGRMSETSTAVSVWLAARSQGPGVEAVIVARTGRSMLPAGRKDPMARRTHPRLDAEDGLGPSLATSTCLGPPTRPRSCLLRCYPPCYRTGTHGTTQNNTNRPDEMLLEGTGAPDGPGNTNVVRLIIRRSLVRVQPAPQILGYGDEEFSAWPNTALGEGRPGRGSRPYGPDRSASTFSRRASCNAWPSRQWFTHE